MSEIRLNSCIPLQWYEVVEGLDILKKGEVIEYINNKGKHLVIGEGFLDEIGVVITDEDAEHIIVKLIIF